MPTARRRRFHVRLSVEDRLELMSLPGRYGNSMAAAESIS
jgi:hypothetical protein